MDKFTPFDRQLADLVCMMSIALRAGYNLQQIFESLASDTPEPAAGECAGIVADLKSGISLDQALTNWQKKVPSAYLANVIAVIKKQAQTGGYLADMLDPLADEVLAKAGTDGSLYPAIRQLAQAVGVKQLPQRFLN